MLIDMESRVCGCLAATRAPCLPNSDTRSLRLRLYQGFLAGNNASLLTRNSLKQLCLRTHQTKAPFVFRVKSESNESSEEKIPFGYTRKDVLLIGLGLIVVGVGLKSGLEFVGVDPLKAGNVVQLVMVLGLTVGWISTYLFRVSTKEMTYAKQLKDYENKVIQKRLEELPEAELESLLAQIEEEKQQLQARKENISNPE
ncbi:hypothetical protein KP509_21G052900 [Ceratopteris richardii]|uniref:Uncharacterized protein n=1 Tax=Ceratopteris richardii TaxID=49495 RepID=A0A8T2SDC6_CERRI|nr:hypothetical protein KP509_21G052900 [Ceratopteris richardii]